MLFRNLDDLKPFIFRIIDNGGETADRFTVITCDGDYFHASTNPTHPQGVGMWGEGGDIVGYADSQVQSGEARDLRWIDLPEKVRDCVFHGLNRGFQDYIESEECAANRDAARDWQGEWRDHSPDREGNRKTPIYRTENGFCIRDDDSDSDKCFATFAEAVRYMLPTDYDLSGPEYFTTADLWDETGGPAPLWDRETDPPAPLDD
jgi:hypothetical protein